MGLRDPATGGSGGLRNLATGGSGGLQVLTVESIMVEDFEGDTWPSEWTTGPFSTTGTSPVPHQGSQCVATTSDGSASTTTLPGPGPGDRMYVYYQYEASAWDMEFFFDTQQNNFTISYRDGNSRFALGTNYSEDDEVSITPSNHAGDWIETVCDWASDGSSMTVSFRNVNTDTDIGTLSITGSFGASGPGYTLDARRVGGSSEWGAFDNIYLVRDVVA